MSRSPITIQEILGQDGMLAHSLKGFEFRSSQLQMALQVRDCLKEGLPAIIEGGTGTGKTFGYLVPVILSGKKTVISTGTKNLQEQIYFKDLPLLQGAIGDQFQIDAMVMKGRKNYLCLHRYHQYLSQTSPLIAGRSETGEKIEEWLKGTEFADRSEIAWLADDDALWDTLSSTSDQCLGAECLYLDECFLGRLRSRAARAKIIIANHHLFFADLKVRRGGFGEIIPRFEAAVFDEAHRIEGIATSYLGESLSTNQLIELAGDLEKEIKALPHPGKPKIKGLLDTIRAASEELSRFFDGQGEKGILDEETLKNLREGPAREAVRGLRHIREHPGLREAEGPTLQILLARAGELDELLGEILSTRDTDWLNWYERRKRSLLLHASPLNISERLNELLYKKVKTVIFTSATISTNGNFDYIRSRLGLPDRALESIYPSHFDFGRQTLLYIPRDLPIPSDPLFGPQVAGRIADILKITGGRALILFTGYHNLNIAYPIIRDRIPYAVHRQGDAPRTVLLDEFRKDIHSVLLATSSFWQGIDVPGEALSCLIIDKLPFDSPGEPLVAGRINVIREREGNPFLEFQLPSAIISLKQGLGRLIRKSSDTGLLSILDNRILASRYGKVFLQSLPEIPITHSLSDITRFFEGERLAKGRERSN
jgi:ATP-dependent DNA helicase DinG